MILDLIYNIPSLLLYVLVSIVLLIIAFSCLLLVRRFIPLEMRYKGNDVIDPVSATISVSYAIVVGLIAISVLNNYDKAEGVVQDEANSVSNIYHYAARLPHPIRIKIEELVKKYLQVVTEEEWLDVEKGKANRAGYPIINKLFSILVNDQVDDPNQSLIVNEIYKELNTLYNIRNKRDNLVDTLLVNEAWIVIGVGALLVIGINCLFGADFRLHAIIIATLTLSVSLVIFLTIALDSPFRGKLSIRPDAFKELSRQLNLEGINN